MKSDKKLVEELIAAALADREHDWRMSEYSDPFDSGIGERLEAAKKKVLDRLRKLRAAGGKK